MSGVVVEFERRIATPPEVVFRFLADADRWIRWQGTEAVIDPRPGGVHRVNIRGDGFASGQVVEVVPDRRIVFTWGFEYPDNPLRPGSTLIEIDLEADGDGTILRFRQSAVPDGFESLARGWAHCLDRLQKAAAGRDPGIDPNLVTTPFAPDRSHGRRPAR